MLNWKIGLAATGVIAVVAATVIVYNKKAVVGNTAEATPNPAMMAMPVPVAKIVKKTIPIYLDYSARTESIRSIALQAKVTGYIQKQHVADGSDVKEGDLLYTIDPRDYQAALDQAKAQAQRDEAALELCARQSRSRQRRWPRPASSPRTPSSSATARWGRARRRSRCRRRR